MESKFKVGDRVRLKANGNIAQVVIVKDGWIAYDESRRFAGSCPMEEAEPIDPKTAFLTRLQSLLREFDAEIRFVEDDYSPAIIFMGHKNEKTRFGKFIDGVILYSNHGCISADSIMDYDKE